MVAGLCARRRGARRRDAELAGVLVGMSTVRRTTFTTLYHLVHLGRACCSLELLYAKFGMLLVRVSNKCIFNWMFLLCDSFAHSLIICLKKREKEVIEIGMAA